MSQSLVQFALPDGDSVLVEATDISPGPVTRGRRAEAAVISAGESLEGLLGKVGPSIAGVVSAVRETASWPDEVGIEFAIKISTDANVIIARSGGEANFKVTAKWSGDRRDG